MALDEGEIGGLRWMARVNPRIGFLWDYSRKHGPVPEYQRLVAEGYANYVSSHRQREKLGYWILPKGRGALEAALAPSPSDAPPA